MATNQETFNEEVVEEKILRLMTNEPSEPIEVDTGVFVVFQRPPFKDKYKGRVWANKRLKEYGIENDEDDPELVYFIRYWGILNVFIKRVFVSDPHGSVKLGGQSVSEYPYDPKEDAQFSSVFEKYVIREVYDKGKPEDVFVTKAIVAHLNWMSENSVSESDIKKSSAPTDGKTS